MSWLCEINHLLRTIFAFDNVLWDGLIGKLMRLPLEFACCQCLRTKVEKTLFQWESHGGDHAKVGFGNFKSSRFSRKRLRHFIKDIPYLALGLTESSFKIGMDWFFGDV